jgi:hypothetical protein
MPIDDRTTNRSYQLPNAGNLLAEDVVRLRAALAAIDADVFARYTKLEVDQLISNLINGAPGALNTLDELAAALGDDANYAATITSALANRYTKAEANALLELKASLAGATFTGNLNIPSLNGGPLAGLRNLLINANPLINQRGYVSGTATTAANQYTLDRWRVVTSGQAISWTDSANVRTVTAPAGGVEEVIEGINVFSGTFTLNWTGTATATVNGSAVAKGGTVTLTGGTDCTVRFSNGTFSLPQLEPGPVATPFERRSYGLELALCQRYFYRTDKGFSLQGYSGGGGANVYAHISFPVPMRAAPTASGTFTGGVNNASQTVTTSAQAFTLQLASISLGDYAVSYSIGNTFSAEL